MAEKTIRIYGQWVKVTRKKDLRRFYFARGYAGQFSSIEMREISFQWVPTWKDALEYAELMMGAHK
jgi:hypothetical protein